MKKIILSGFLLTATAFFCFAQSGKKIETDYATLLNKYPTYLYAKYKVADTSTVLELRGGDIAVAVVEAGDKLVLKLADSSEVQAYSIAKQNFTVDDNAKYYTHDYRISPASIQSLSKQKLVWIRKYSSGNFTDIPVPENYSESLEKLSVLVLEKSGK